MVCIEWGWQWYKNHLMSAIIICMISDINQQSLRKIKVAKEFSLKKNCCTYNSTTSTYCLRVHCVTD